MLDKWPWDECMDYLHSTYYIAAHCCAPDPGDVSLIGPCDIENTRVVNKLERRPVQLRCSIHIGWRN